MRSRLEQSLNKIWYGDKNPGIFLSLLEKIYRVGFALSQRLGRLRRPADLEGMPILVVGNLNAGGSGKTPMVIRLCELALSCGLNPGVVSRGYGRRSKGALRVTVDSDASETGDEPLLISRRCKVPVQVDSDRESAARILFDDLVDLVICDDGLQRARLPRFLEICVVDQSRGFGNGRQLPAGPLREPVSRLETVDFVVEHLAAGHYPELPDGHSMCLRPGKLVQLNGTETMELATLKTQASEIHAIAGIARPERFFTMLEREGINARCHPFPDHHRFRSSDFNTIPVGSMIIMTEKDAVKCQNLALKNAWYVPVNATLSNELEAALIQKLQALKKPSGLQPTGISTP